MVADPNQQGTFYTVVVGSDTADGGTNANGIYRSTNYGQSWKMISNTAVNNDLTTAATHNVQLSVGNSVTNNGVTTEPLYVGIADPYSLAPGHAADNSNDYLAYLWQATITTSSPTSIAWKPLDLPKTVDGGVTNYLTMPYVPATDAGNVPDPLSELPSGKYSLGFSLAADTNSNDTDCQNLVFVGGGTQPVIGAGSSIKATEYTGRLFSVDAAKAAGSQTAPLTDSGTANGTAPHAGSRVMAFDGSCLLEGDDGGLFAQTSPDSGSGDWISLNAGYYLQLSATATPISGDKLTITGLLNGKAVSETFQFVTAGNSPTSVLIAGGTNAELDTANNLVSTINALTVKINGVTVKFDVTATLVQTTSGQFQVDLSGALGIPVFQSTAATPAVSLASTGIGATELYAAAYDNLSDTIAGSAQDVNVSAQTQNAATDAAGNMPSPTWQDVGTAPTNTTGVAEGGAVAVDDYSLSGSLPSPQSYRYTSSQYLDNFEQQTIAANGTVVPGSTVQITALNGDGQLHTPVVVNPIDGNIAVGGLNAVYISANGGTSFTTVGLGVAGGANALVYGGYQGITPEANVLWVATDNGVYLRQPTGNLAATAYPGATPVSITVDSTDWTQAWVIADNSQIWYTSNKGLAGTWTNITPTSGYLPSGLLTACYVPGLVTSSGLPKAGALLVGGSQGVYFTVTPTVSTATWQKLSADLPLVPVTGLSYNPYGTVAQTDTLVAATLGRGAWELNDLRENIFGIPNVITVQSNDGTVICQGGNAVSPTPTLTASPEELDITFNKYSSLDQGTLPSPTDPNSGILVVYAGDNGAFYDGSSGYNSTDSFHAGDSDDQVITPGYVGFSPSNPDEVILRFASALPNGKYEVILVGQEGYTAANRKAVSPLQNTAGLPFADQPSTGKGENLVLNFTVSLPPQVVSVNPQPIVSQTQFTVSSQPTGTLALSTVAVPSTGVSPVTVPTTFQFNDDYLNCSNTQLPLNGDEVIIEGLAPYIGYLSASDEMVSNTFTFSTSVSSYVKFSNQVPIGATAAATIANLEEAIQYPEFPFGVSVSQSQPAGSANLYLNGYTSTPTFAGTAISFVVPGTAFVAGNVAVSALSTDSPVQIAANLGAAINSAGAAGLTATVSSSTVAVDASGLAVGAVPTGITQVTASLPQMQLRSTIDVYFTDGDPLTAASATNWNFYQLIDTNGSADDAKDTVYYPTSAYYDANLNRVRLTFAADLATLGTGEFRLRVGDAYAVDTTATASTNLATDANDSTIGTVNLGTLEELETSATAVELNNPTGVAVDTAGDVFIADSQNNRVLRSRFQRRHGRRRERQCRLHRRRHPGHRRRTERPHGSCRERGGYSALYRRLGQQSDPRGEPHHRRNQHLRWDRQHHGVERPNGSCRERGWYRRLL